MSLFKVNDRQSNIELLRCFSMFFVIVYHVLIFCLQQFDTELRICQSLEIPFHIGVPLFVMISGYFGIKVSFKGLTKLLSKTFVFCSLIAVISLRFDESGTKQIIKSFLFVSFGNLWFLNCYIYLFLLSPFINKMLKNITANQRIYLISVLLFCSVWIGAITQGDVYLFEGKNIMHFVLLYVLGNTLRKKQEFVNEIQQYKLVFSFVILNVLLVLGFLFMPIPIAGKIWKFSFGYNSPIMLINCVLFFMIFSKLKINSKAVNWFGSSMFACYLIHSGGFVWKTFFELPAKYFHTICGNFFIMFIAVIFYIFCIMFVMVCIDKLLTPLWDKLSLIAGKVDKKWNIKLLQ